VSSAPPELQRVHCWVKAKSQLKPALDQHLWPDFQPLEQGQGPLSAPPSGRPSLEQVVQLEQQQQRLTPGKALVEPRPQIGESPAAEALESELEW